MNNLNKGKSIIASGLDKVKLERVLQLLLRLFIILHLHLPILQFVLPRYLRLFSQLLLHLRVTLLNNLAPISVDILRNPRLNLHPRHSLHPKYLESYTITTNSRVRYSLDVLVVLRLRVGQHGVDRRKFLGAARTTEMLGLLVVMQNDLVLVGLLAVEAERTHATQITALSTHLTMIILL